MTIDYSELYIGIPEENRTQSWPEGYVFSDVGIVYIGQSLPDGVSFAEIDDVIAYESDSGTVLDAYLGFD